MLTTTKRILALTALTAVLAVCLPPSAFGCDADKASYDAAVKKATDFL